GVSGRCRPAQPPPGVDLVRAITAGAGAAGVAADPSGDRTPSRAVEPRWGARAFAQAVVGPGPRLNQLSKSWTAVSVSGCESSGVVVLLSSPGAYATLNSHQPPRQHPAPNP